MLVYEEGSNEKLAEVLWVMPCWAVVPDEL